MFGRRLSGKALLTLAALILAAAWSLLLARLHLEGGPNLLERIEAPLTDLRVQLAGRRPPPRGVVIVAIDDETVRETGNYPLRRLALTRLISEIAARNPASIAIDLLLVDPAAPATDRTLADTLRAAPTVLAAAALFDAEGAAPEAAGPPNPVSGALPRADRVLWPMPIMREGIALGFVNVASDHAGTPRHIPLAIETEGRVVPSFVLRAAALAAGRDPLLSDQSVTITPDRPPVRLDLGRYLPLRYYGPRGTVPTLSAARLLRGDLPAEVLAGRVVVVGATAIGSGDTFATPFDPIMPGVEILATGIAHLTHGDGLVRDRRVRLADSLIALVLALGAVGTLALATPGLGIALVAALAAGFLAASAFAFAQGIWLAAAMPLAAMLLPALVFGLGRQAIDRRRAGQVAATSEQLRRFQAAPLAAEIEANPGYLAEPVAGRASVLFLDLSGFTRLSEGLGPAVTRDYLQGFQALVESTVTAHRGVVMSYMGDGAMIAFGLPHPEPDDAARALAAAFALQRGVTAWMESHPAARRLGVRVGGQSGPVVFSRLGAATHQQIAATGDSVNVAARLLEVASREEAAIALGAALLEAAAPAAPPVAPLAIREIAIRGRRQPLTVAFWRAQDLEALRAH